jgi:hypothetical protein
MSTRREGLTSDSIEERIQTSSDPQSTLDPSRPIWEIVVEIGAQIPDDVWATVPNDASINYRRYLYVASEIPE